MDPTALAALIARLLDENGRDDELATLDDAELTAARQQLADYVRSVRAGEVDDVAPDDLEVLTRVRDAVQVIQAEQTRRADAAAAEAAAAAERAAEASTLEAEILGEETGEVEPEAAEITDPEGTTEETDPEPAPVLDPAAAAATVDPPAPAPAPAPARPPLSALLQARPDDARPRPNEMVAQPRWQLRDGTAADFADRIAIAERIATARSELLSASPGFADKITVASIKVPWPEERMLHTKHSVVEIDAKLEAVTAAASQPWDEETLEAVTASGGWCAMPEPRYDIPTVANGERPFRDALARIGADRGGIVHTRAASLSTIRTGGPQVPNAAITRWPAAIDANPGELTKGRQRIPCAVPVEEELEPIVARLLFGNLQTRAFPEHVAASIDLAMAAHARIADQALLDRLIDAMANDVSQTGFVGTARALKHHALQARAQIRSTERLGDTPRIRAAIAREAVDMIVGDVTNQAASGSVDALLIDEPWVRRFLMTAGVVFSFTHDTPSGADAFVANADGQNLANWPSNFEIPFWIDGTAVFLDGGELNLGIVRDCSTNDTNDYELFVETFEGLAWLGPFGLTLTLTNCPTGVSQAAKSDASDNLCAAS